MSTLHQGNFGATPIRVVMKDGEPWWLATDMCKVLGLEAHGGLLGQTRVWASETPRTRRSKFTQSVRSRSVNQF